MHSRGFTTIEMAVVMAIMAILLAIGAPNLMTFMAGSEMRSNSSSLIGDIGLARAEALRTRRSVTICARDAGTDTCGTNWANGWMIFQDADSNGVRVATEAIFRSTEAPGGKVVVTGPNSFTFRSSGTSAGTGTLQLRRDSTLGRDIQVIPGGRVISIVVPI
jgi:type IV fimbrial biogenesis protein FimT